MSNPAPGGCPGKLAALLTGVALLPAGAWAHAAVEPGTPGIAPESARYELSLSHASRDTIDASGTMVYRIEDRCDAWSSEQRLHLSLVTRDGGASDTVSDYATLESKDGSRLVFHTSQIQDGTPGDSLDGVAERKSNGRVEVHFLRPTDKRIELPPETLFPLAHTMAILAAARRGERAIEPLLFDGTTLAGAFYTYVTISPWVPHPVALPERWLGDQGAARAHVAFFSMAPGTVSPDFELSARYFANGAADSIVMDFGDFRLDGHVTALSPGQRPHCGARRAAAAHPVP